MGNLYQQREFTHCDYCNRELRTLVKLDFNDLPTTKTTKVCINNNCTMFIDPKKIEGWRLLRYNISDDEIQE